MLVGELEGLEGPHSETKAFGRKHRRKLNDLKQLMIGFTPALGELA